MTKYIINAAIAVGITSVFAFAYKYYSLLVNDKLTKQSEQIQNERKKSFEEVKNDLTKKYYEKTKDSDDENFTDNVILMTVKEKKHEN